MFYFESFNVLKLDSSKQIEMFSGFWRKQGICYHLFTHGIACDKCLADSPNWVDCLDLFSLLRKRLIENFRYPQVDLRKGGPSHPITPNILGRWVATHWRPAKKTSIAKLRGVQY